MSEETRAGGPPGRLGRILVVEDDDGLRALLRDELEDDGYGVRTAATAGEALSILSAEPTDLVVSDLRLPDLDALGLLERVREGEDPPAFLVITAFGTIDQAVRALQEGAEDFLTKPLDLEHFSVRVARALRNRRLRSQVEWYRQALEGDDFHGMVGRSPAMRALFRTLEPVARGRGPVLLEGESGVGKELAARAVHRASPRAGGPFLAVNCAGVPESLLESEFFGHLKGAFTGATGRRKGLFQEAEGGTLLLDEIGEMPRSLQAKLLRVLQEDKVRAVGDDREREVDVRIVASTNRELEADVREGRFRKDLFFRLETFRVRIPPLREREGDLDLLALHFVRRHAARLGREAPTPSPRFLARLHRHPFPGNVRELENAVERAVTFCEGGRLEVRHLPERIRRGAPEGGNGEDGPRLGLDRGEDREDAFLLDGGFLPSLEELERRYIRLVLDRLDGNKRRAAALLGISRRTLYRRLARAEEEAGEGGGDGEDPDPGGA